MAKSPFEVRLDESLNSLTLTLHSVETVERRFFCFLANYFAKQTDKVATY